MLKHRVFQPIWGLFLGLAMLLLFCVSPSPLSFVEAESLQGLYRLLRLEPEEGEPRPITGTIDTSYCATFDTKENQLILRRVLDPSIFPNTLILQTKRDSLSLKQIHLAKVFFEEELYSQQIHFLAHDRFQIQAVTGHKGIFLRASTQCSGFFP